MASILPLISNSNRLFSKPFRTATNAPTKISISITFMFLQFSGQLQEFVYLFGFFSFFYFHSVFRWNNQIYKMTGSFFFFFFLLINFRSCLLTGIWLFVRISKPQIILCDSFACAVFDLYIYHLVIWSNSNLLHNSKWISFPPNRAWSCILFCLFTEFAYYTSNRFISVPT